MENNQKQLLHIKQQYLALKPDIDVALYYKWANHHDARGSRKRAMRLRQRAREAQAHYRIKLDALLNDAATLLGLTMDVAASTQQKRHMIAERLGQI